MNAALESERGPAAAEPARKRLLSVADYHRMGEAGIFAPDERVELIEGEIIAMPPIGPEHAGLVDQLNRLLGTSVGDSAVVRVQNPVRLSDISEPEPDLALLRPRDDFYKTAHPKPEDTLLAIEVANSTLVHDRDVKAPLYARHGVPELWLVDVQNKRLSVYREPDGRDYAHRFTHPLAAPLTPALLPDVAIDLSALFDEDPPHR